MTRRSDGPPRPFDHEQRLWTARETAEFLRINERTLRRISVPRIAIYARPGARPIVRYDPAEVRAWVDARKSRTLLHAPPRNLNPSLHRPSR